VVRAYRGADKVPVTTELLAAVKFSLANYTAEKSKEQESKRKSEDKAKGEAEAKKIREEKEEEKRTWESKKKSAEDSLKTLDDEIKNQNNVMSAAVRRAKTIKELSCLKTIEDCQGKIIEKTKEQAKLQEKLKKLMGKKPKDI